MEKSEHQTRREFCQRLAVATGVVGLPGVAGVSALRAADRPAQSTPDAVLEKLLKGNQRFVEGKPMHPRRGPKDFAAVGRRTSSTSPSSSPVPIRGSRRNWSSIRGSVIYLSSASRATSSAAPAPR